MKPDPDFPGGALPLVHSGLQKHSLPLRAILDVSSAAAGGDFSFLLRKSSRERTLRNQTFIPGGEPLLSLIHI